MITAAAHSGTLPKAAQGFTIMELMIVVVIVSLLSMVAIPTYQNHVADTRRTAATACLGELAQWMERYYANGFSYADATLPNKQCIDDVSEVYALALVSDANTYALTATAIGPQLATDAACTPLRIDQMNVKSPAECW
jgi:type IV pilus assembly protein PilE